MVITWFQLCAISVASGLLPSQTLVATCFLSFYAQYPDNALLINLRITAVAECDSRGFVINVTGYHLISCSRSSFITEVYNPKNGLTLLPSRGKTIVGHFD